MSYKLGSLFDGSGGFPLSGALCGVEPVWAAEVEPYPIAVTRSRFPNMKHLGDISKINGGEIEPVDIITFGSPCQDLSVAGKRAGLKHAANGDEETTRSGLFMEAVRIIKEMRSATNGKYPRFALWENVPGAFSSNKGEDFRIVCEELIKIVEPTASMPSVPKGGWAYADSYVGDGWSLAYRVFDAQYWGVPQRRRRIHLVADFGGQCAREILFEREGVRGYFAEGRTPWQTTTADAQRGVGADDREGVQPYTLDAGGKNQDSQGRLRDWQGSDRERGDRSVYPAEYDGYNRVSIGFPLGFRPENVRLYDEVATTLVNGTRAGFTVGVIESQPIYAVDQGGDKSGANVLEGMAPTLCTTHGGEPVVAYKFDSAVVFDGGNITSPLNKTNPQPGDPCHTLYTDSRNYVVFCLQGNGIDRADTAGCNGKGVKEDICYTLNTIDRPAVAYQERVGSLCARDYKGVGSQYVDEDKLVVQGNPVRYIVRRLTPTECARLQGFADWWGHIEPKDSLTDEEYRFWCDVYLTKQIIDGKVEYDENGELRYTSTKKPYQHKNPKQMLTWYNKLYTDSAEYKMWGNGIALPPALYCLQGIVDVLSRGAGKTTENAEPTDLSDAPPEIKEEILANADKLEAKKMEVATSPKTLKVRPIAKRKVVAAVIKRDAKHRVTKQRRTHRHGHCNH